MIQNIISSIVGIVTGVVSFYVGLVQSLMTLKLESIVEYIKSFWAQSLMNKISMVLAVALPVLIFMMLKRRK